jgi:hypothetical protein
MKLALALLLALAVALATCTVGSGTVSLSGGSGYKVGPPLWMDGAYRVRLSMESPEAAGCIDWVLALKYDTLDTFVWATGADGAEFVDGEYLATTSAVDNRLRVTASIPHACGPWTAEFTPLDG